MTAHPAAIAAATTEDSVGDLIAHALAEIGVTTVFGVISIHNMPILDAVARQGRIRFIPARGEAGAMNMADAYARVSGTLGVVITSTGTAAGNAAGSQVEALIAGSPVLHITSQVDRVFMDRDQGAIHDAPRQFEMLKAISKACFRVWEGRSAVGMLLAAARAALTPPSGPVSLEIPVDVQRERSGRPDPIRLGPIAGPEPDPALLDSLAARLKAARRPLLWLGGGARGAEEPARALADRGIGIVTSTNGRAVVPEDHPASLGAFNMTPEAQAIYDRADLMIVVGSRLRGNETRNNRMRLPPIVQIDADGAQAARNYPVEAFIAGDAARALAGLARRLPERLDTDAQFLAAIGGARAKSEAALRDSLGPYAAVAEAMRRRVHDGRLPFVRDITVSNSTFGNRYVTLAEPRLGVHALGGGIGQGVAMAIGAALAGTGRKTVALVGDGGTMVNLGELATAVEAQADIVFVLMNDRGYGVIRNIQDAQYGSRHHYVDLHTPDFAGLAAAIGFGHRRVAAAADFAPAFDEAMAAPGPQMVEVDMTAIGPFRQAFAGPPAGAAGTA
ncbi:MAG TPA: thiamine pyrophosphate-binding protein [Hyphomicrobiales bacterium]|nr:thiamine pyrophosphate-binding protein [Hyphomicrobiales bacterium]